MRRRRKKRIVVMMSMIMKRIQIGNKHHFSDG